MLLSAGDHLNFFLWLLPANIECSLHDMNIEVSFAYLIQINGDYVNSKHKLGIFRVDGDACRRWVKRGFDGATPVDDFHVGSLNGYVHE
jgi:hypothetical protein